MDSSGFLSPRANAFSIAHLIDRAQLADLAFLRGQNPNYNWNSQVLLKDMEGTTIMRARAINQIRVRIDFGTTFPAVFLGVDECLSL